VTPWQRKPVLAEGPERASERIVVSVAGASTLMVPRGDHYVPFASGQYQELRQVGAAWKLTTLDNLEYTFAAGVSTDLWFLTEIRERAGRDRVELRYAYDGVAAQPARCAYEPRLASVAYTFDAAGQVPLYEIVLEHEPWWRPRYERTSGETVACGTRVVDGHDEEAYGSPSIACAP
jgi:hypothetical protein